LHVRDDVFVELRDLRDIADTIAGKRATASAPPIAAANDARFMPATISGALGR
jgi:hypothetical protein